MGSVRIIFVWCIVATATPSVAQPLPASHTVTKQICVVIDNGISMMQPCGSGTRRDIALDCIEHIINSCPDGDRLMVARLQDSQYHGLGSHNLSPSHRDRLINDIRQAKPSGVAKIGECLKAQQAAWGEFSHIPTTYFVISDGERCGVDDLSLISDIHSRCHPSSKFVVVNTCDWNLNSQAMHQFAEQCKGIFSCCDGKRDSTQEIKQLIQLLVARDSESNTALTQAVLSQIQHHAQIRVDLAQARSELIKSLSEVSSENLKERLAIIEEFRAVENRFEKLFRAEQSIWTKLREISELVAKNDQDKQVAVLVQKIDLMHAEIEVSHKSLDAISRDLLLLRQVKEPSESERSILWYFWVLTLAFIGSLLAMALKSIFSGAQDQSHPNTNGAVEHMVTSLTRQYQELYTLGIATSQKVELLQQKVDTLSRTRFCEAPKAKPPSPRPNPPTPGNELDIVSAERNPMPSNTDDEILSIVYGNKRVATILYSQGITTVEALAGMPQDQIDKVSDLLPDVSIATIQRWVSEAKSAVNR